MRLSKEEWNYFQRLTLVLRSNVHIAVNTRRRWDCTQLIAVAAFLLFLNAANGLGWGIHLLVLAIPFGLVSIGIFHWRNRFTSKKVDRSTILLAPFSSFFELITIRRRVANFRKHKCPDGMKRHEIRSPLEEAMIKIQTYAAWLLCSPLVLVYQALPTTETNTRVEGKKGISPIIERQ